MLGLGLDHTQCGIRIRVIGIDLDGRAKLLFGAREGSLLRQKKAEVDIRFAVLGIVLDGLLKQRRSFCTLALLAVKYAKVALRFGECRISVPMPA